MTYLTCTKHRSFQRKHIDVCRQCPDNDQCDAFQAHAATEPPPPPPPEPVESTIPIRMLLDELADIRELVADWPAQQKKAPLPRPKKPFDGSEMLAFIRSELAEISKLC